MKRSLRILLAVAVISLTSSCNSIANLRKPPTNQEVAICPANAFINVTEYQITGPKDNADFPRYSVELATKYPDLKNAYTLLYQCWNHYHPIKK